MSHSSRKLEYCVEWRGPNQWLNMCPAWAQKLDREFSWQTNRLIFAITDVKADIKRLDDEFGGLE